MVTEPKPKRESLEKDQELISSQININGNVTGSTIIIGNENSVQNTSQEVDSEKIRDYRKVFDRAAFRTPCIFESTLVHLEAAIDDTLAAMATGSLFSRSNRLLLRIVPKSDFLDEPYKSGLERVTIYLDDLRKKAIELQNLLSHLIHQYLDVEETIESYYLIEPLIGKLIAFDSPYDKMLASLQLMDDIDRTRNLIIDEINGLLYFSSSPPLPKIPLSTEQIIQSSEPEMHYRWDKFYVDGWEHIISLLTESGNGDKTDSQ